MSLALLCASMPAANGAQAASNPKLSTNSLSLKVGQSKKLTVNGASGTVKWSSSNKKIVAVAKTTNKAAKVTAKKAGTAQVKAKVGKKVLKCKVTVKKADQNTTTQAPNTQAPVVQAPASQASSAPETSASVQPTETATEAPTPTGSATDDSSSDKVLAKLILSEDRKTVTGVENSSDATYAVIPDGVTSIGDHAFENCTSLISIAIPNTVTSISEYAFNNVPHIEYHGSELGEPWGANSMN